MHAMLLYWMVVVLCDHGEVETCIARMVMNRSREGKRPEQGLASGNQEF